MGKAKTAEELYQEGYAATQAKGYQRAKLLLEQSLSLDKNPENKVVCRNILGKVYEKLGEIEAAITLYEQNVADEFEGDFPYDRLRVIYHRQNCFADEVRVLGKAVKVFEEKAYPGRSDRLPKLEKFRLNPMIKPQTILKLN